MYNTKCTFFNKTLTLKQDVNEPLEPYYFMICQASRIIFESKCDEQIILFPSTIYLKFNNEYNYPIVLTPTFKHLVIESMYTCAFPLKLPMKFESLNIYHFTLPIELNKYMKCFSMIYDSIHTLKLNKSLCYFEQSSVVNLALNKNLKQLWVGNLYQLDLPKHLTHLTGYIYSNKVMPLPADIIYLQIGYDFLSKYFILEHSTEQVHIFSHSKDYYLIDNLPNNKKPITLECELSMELNNLPNNLIIDNRF